MTTKKDAKRNQAWIDFIEDAINSLEGARDAIESEEWEDALGYLDDADHLAGVWLEIKALTEGKTVEEITGNHVKRMVA